MLKFLFLGGGGGRLLACPMLWVAFSLRFGYQLMNLEMEG